MSDSLRYLQAIVENGGFSAAANKLFLSQPALSRHVGRLEQSLGVKLIDRNSEPLALTPEGHRYADYLRDIERMHSRMEADLGGMGQRVRETVRLGCTTWRSSQLLPRVLPELLIPRPDLRINVHGGSNLDLLHGIRARKLDLAVSNVPQAGVGMHFESIAEEKVALVGADLELDDDLAELASVGASLQGAQLRSVLSSSRLILMHPEHNLGAICRDFLTTQGIPNGRTINTDNIELTMQLAARGAGLAFVPSGAVALPHSPKVPHIVLDDAALIQQIGLSWPLGTAPQGGVAALADTLRKVIIGDSPDSQDDANAETV